MASAMMNLPSLRRQSLLTEFTGLRQACPEGVYVALTPGDVTLWSGILFIRRGPYASAILRFQISFPDAYPDRPPLVTFSTDIFHPLITPLTTYTYTTDIQDNGTVSASDDERLPPGGFNLRVGFPAWFGRGKRRSSQFPAGVPQTPTPRRVQTPPPHVPNPATSVASGSPAGTAAGAVPSYMLTDPPGGEEAAATPYDVLRYIRSTFDDEAVMDAIPLEAAGHPGAWHAWRAHRRQQGVSVGGTSQGGAPAEPTSTTVAGTPAPAPTTTPAAPTAPTAPTARDPGEWNWENVWEERVKKNISASLSDAVLYGGAGGTDDMIHFLSMNDAEIQTAKENLKNTLGEAV